MKRFNLKACILLHGVGWRYHNTVWKQPQAHDSPTVWLTITKELCNFLIKDYVSN
jgi:hypothetical protein